MSSSGVAGSSENGGLPAEIEWLTRSGSQALEKDDRDQALALFKKAFLLSNTLPEGQMQRTCLFNLGAAYTAAGRAQKGLKCFVKCRLQEPEQRDADLHFNIAIAYDELKEYAKAVRFYRKAVGGYAPGQANSMGDALIKLAYCCVSLGDATSAAESFSWAGQSYQHAGRREDAAMALRESANYMIRSGGVSEEQVLGVLQECLQTSRGITNPSLKGKLLNDVGLHYAELKSFHAAGQCFSEALACCSGQNFSIRRRAVLLQNMGAIHNALQRYAESLTYHTESAEMYGSLVERKGQGESLCNLAYAYSQMKNYQAAALHYQEALQAFADIGDLRGQWQVCEGLGATHFCLGNADQALSYYKQALVLFGESKEASDVPKERIWRKLKDVLDSVGALPESESRRQALSTCAQSSLSTKFGEDSLRFSVPKQHCERPGSELRMGMLQ
uniref:Tetratricopeptide repeat protein 24-like n=1 Tax=Lepisosteus oculatus TaxID=7918 RepID=W5N802_LEPOC|nr:PREDICTED: tetratricopeptide repeat protein 24-like isoform X1 [Lepisosteus oculatus]